MAINSGIHRRTKHGLGVLGALAFAFALALIWAYALLAANSISVAANSQSAADARIRDWVIQLGEARLTPSRHLAQQHLEEAGAASLGPLVRALDGPNASLRRNAAGMLGFIGSPLAARALVNALSSDPDPSVRSRAAWALGELGDFAVMGALEHAAAFDPDFEVRQEAEASLAALRARLTFAAAQGVRLFRF